MVFKKRHVINKNGKTYTYFSLTKSVRIPGKPYPIHQYIEYLGNDSSAVSYKSSSDVAPIGGSLEVKTEKQRYEPMRPSPTAEIPKEGYLAEIKHDGVRTSAYVTKAGLKFINRRNVVTTERYPELQDIYKKLRFNKNVILDGEIVHISKTYPYGDFKKLSMREHLIHPEEIKQRAKKIPLTFIVFDILEKDGKPLINMPLIERKKILNEVVPDNLKNIKEIQYKLDGKGLLDIAAKRHGEGVVFKKADSIYVPKKESSEWIKAKLLKANDVVVIGYSPGTGERKGLFGALYTAYWDKKNKKFVYAGKTGTGFKKKESGKGITLKEMYSKMWSLRTSKVYVKGVKGQIQWIKPQLVARVRFVALTPQSIMREPVFETLRNDIPPESTHIEKVMPIKTFSSFSLNSLNLIDPVIKVEKKGRIVTTRKPEEVLRLAKHIENKLKPYSRKTLLAGSIRRRQPATDVDLVVIPKSSGKEKIRNILDKMGTIKVAGEKQIFSNIKNVPVDVYFATEKDFGAQILTRTGSFGHNIGLRKIALSRNMKLNQEGLWKNNKLIASKTEEDIYKALGRPRFKQPWERE